MIDARIGDSSYISKRLQWLGLVENPFLPYPDGRYYIPTSGQRLAYQDITEVITQKAPNSLCVVMGEPGSGKTALAHRLARAAFPGNYLSALGLVLSEGDRTPAKMVKSVLNSLSLRPAKGQRERMDVLRVELEKRMMILNESVFLAVDTTLGEDSIEALQETLRWTFRDQGLVQLALFINREGFFSIPGFVSRARVVHTLSAPPIRELTQLLHTLVQMTGRSDPLFTDEAMELLIDRSGRNLGSLMRLSSRALQALIDSPEDRITVEMVREL